jgi:hypothetical protein
MENNIVNAHSLQFSPYIWWKSIQRGIDFSEIYGAGLIPEFSFKNWLQEAIIEHSSLNLVADEYSPNGEYIRATKNSYYDQVGFINKYGSKFTAKTEDDLRRKPTFKEGYALFYTFKVDTLFHLTTLHFQHWLLFDDFYHWVRWQLYFDFIVAKCDKTIAGLFQQMWAISLSEVDFNHQVFKEVEQYKKFRDRLEEINSESEFIREEYIKLKARKQS